MPYSTAWRCFWSLLIVVSLWVGSLLDPSWLPYLIPRTASLPTGVYRLLPAEVRRAPIPSGSVVLVCIDAEAAKMGVDRGYLMRGSCPGGAEPVGKPVVASEGDVVDVTDAETRVNGKPLPHSFRHRIDSRGRDLPSVPEGTYVLRPGELWIASDEHPKSWDSRYYGPVHEAHVRGVLELSLLWEWPFFPWLTESD